MKITNIDKGPRGVFTEDGQVTLMPGESRDVNLSDAEAKGLNKEWFATGAKAEAAAKAEAEDEKKA